MPNPDGKARIAIHSELHARTASPAFAAGQATDALTLSLGGGPEAAGIARRALTQLDGDIDVPVLETMRLLITELVANSVKHARVDAMLLRVKLTGPTVLVEVTDDGPGFEPTPRSARGGDAGWGLYLVERLAHRWGVHRDGVCTRVWFELRR